MAHRADMAPEALHVWAALPAAGYIRL